MFLVALFKQLRYGRTRHLAVDIELPLAGPVPAGSPRAMAAIGGLTPASQAWLASLPIRTRPHCLADCAPEIVNRLAVCWDDPRVAGQVLHELLVGESRNLKTLPSEVTVELLRLHALIGRKQAAGAAESGSTAHWERHLTHQ